MTAPTAKAVLVPGAWMGSWIWEPTVHRLRDRGIDAEAITLRGLETGLSDATVELLVAEIHHHASARG
jgi:hypothetical protein